MSSKAGMGLGIRRDNGLEIYVRNKEDICTTSRLQGSGSVEESYRGSNASGKIQFSLKLRRNREYIDNHRDDIDDFAD